MTINYYRALTNAVAELKFRRVIGFNSDIIRDTGVHKSALSMYLNGKEMPSKKFIRDFENAYKVKLADYDKDPDQDIKNPAQEPGREREIELLNQIIAEKERSIKIHSDLLETKMKAIEHRQLIVLEQILRLREKLTKEDFAELAVKANNSLAELLGAK